METAGASAIEIFIKKPSIPPWKLGAKASGLLWKSSASRSPRGVDGASRINRKAVDVFSSTAPKIEAKRSRLTESAQFQFFHLNHN
jgi:hypothetical protein